MGNRITYSESLPQNCKTVYSVVIERLAWLCWITNKIPSAEEVSDQLYWRHDDALRGFLQPDDYDWSSSVRVAPVDGLTVFADVAE